MKRGVAEKDWGGGGRGGGGIVTNEILHRAGC